MKQPRTSSKPPVTIRFFKKNDALSETSQQQGTNKKRGRGRPGNLPWLQKGTYKSVLLPRDIVETIQLLNERNTHLTPQTLAVYIDRMEADEEWRAYYWQMIVSYTIYLYLDTISRDGETSPTDIIPHPKGRKSTRSFTMPQIAETLNIRTFNLKVIAQGKGATEIFIRFVDTLYKKDIHLFAIKNQPGVVLLAYQQFNRGKAS